MDSKGFENLTMFLVRVLQEILNDKECKRSQNSELRKLCEGFLAELTKDGDTNSKGATLPDLVAPFDYNRYFEPFQLASKSGSARLVKLSLDSIQKFIAHGHLLGRCEDPKEPGKPLIDRIVRTVCECFKGTNTDEKVELQILKALLTILTSQLVEVHGSSLLLAVKTCFNICLVSRNVINQTTARATLTQIINVIFYKMEQESTIAQHNVDLVCSAFGDEMMDLKDNPFFRDDEYTCVEDAASIVLNDLIQRVIEQESVPPTAADTNLRRRKSDVLLESASLLQKDAFYVMSSLCRISQRPLAVNTNEQRAVLSFEFRSKQLSLQLLLSILQAPRPSLQNNPLFISLIRNQLSMSLSSNAVSNIATIFELSLAVFVSLLAAFKTHLKVHIEVFFKEILFPIAESPNSSFEHKFIVLRAFLAICYDRQIIIDLYINYDCNLRSFNVLKHLVGTLSRIGQGRPAAEIGCTTGEEELAFRLMGLESLVAILFSLRGWSAELESGDRRSRSNSSSSSGAASSDESVDSPDKNSAALDLEHTKEHKNVIEGGIQLFNQKPIHGLNFLCEHNIIQNECSDIASFLHTYEEKLNKRVVGEFLSAPEKLNKEIMFAYVDQLDFSNLSFIAALRKFLAGFRLPGEAQKIDRLMEKFAARFCECNQNVEIFSNADTAYVLAYSIIMLTTDLHSSQVKHKMTKEQYINLNRGINESRDLPYNYLSRIYDEIASEELRMKYPDEPRQHRKDLSGSSKLRNRRLLFGMEMEHIQYIARSLLENAASWPTENFLSINHSAVIGLLFKILWSPCMVTFSLGLQECDNPEVIQMCLKGIQHCIFIAGVFNQTVERDALLQCLLHFTTFGHSPPGALASHQPKDKNMACIETLIETAFESGNFILSAWPDILRCFSQIECELMRAGTRQSISQTLPRSTRFIPNESLNNAFEQHLVVSIDRIFSNSISFSGDSIVEFVRSLCAVSSEELKRNPARTYCLQKILEISYYNMDRVRLQWSRTWSYVAEHLIDACGSNNVEVVTFAVDSLRQLSLKFLDKEELTNFHFQEDFLRPFGSIMRRARFATVRDMLLRSVEQMINSQARNIRSGWKTIISVVLIGATDSKKDVASLAFTCICRITDDVLDVYFKHMVDALQDCIKCLAEFASYAESAEVATGAVGLIVKTADLISSHSEVFREKFDEEVVGVALEDRIWVKGWLPIVFELCNVVNQCRPPFRTHGITALFDILTKFGPQFKSRWWEESLSIVLRIFERMPALPVGLPVMAGRVELTHETSSFGSEWSSTACTQVLHCLTDLYCSEQNFDALRTLLLDSLCPLFLRILASGSPELGRASLRCVEKLAFGCCDRFEPAEWTTVTSTICQLIEFHDQLRSDSPPSAPLRATERSARGPFPRSQIPIDELITCAMGIFRNKSSFDQRVQLMGNRENTSDNAKVASTAATRVMKAMPDEFAFDVLNRFGSAFLCNRSAVGSDPDRWVASAWMEFALASRVDATLATAEFKYLSQAISHLTDPATQGLSISRDHCLSHLAVVLYDVLLLDSDDKFLNATRQIAQALCKSISEATVNLYRQVLSEICLRRFCIT